MRACVEHWHEVPELKEVWLSLLRRFADAIAAEIDRERADGNAPPGPPSRSLAATLIWSSERCLYVASSGSDTDLPDMDLTLECLITLWTGVVYGPVRTL